MADRTLQLTVGAVAVLHDSARGLAEVKRDAVRHAAGAERAAHEAELRAVEAILGQAGPTVSGPPALVRELLRDAALTTAEQLAAALGAASPDVRRGRELADTLGALLDALA